MQMSVNISRTAIVIFASKVQREKSTRYDDSRYSGEDVRVSPQSMYLKGGRQVSPGEL